MDRIVAGLALIALPLTAQTRVIRGPPDLGTPRNMPPGPSVTDWQPRARAVTEGTIVLTEPSFRVADLRVAIGQVRRLPVNVAVSTPTVRDRKVTVCGSSESGCGGHTASVAVS
ncbi:MAG: hypothetical protein IPK85_08205 [Gemmatimonadetes bacterium]|nr:hypothetical protein [Gemmatimonadota bacterium]